ncbi:probable amino acid efflux protein, LysE family [Rhizobium etli CFN 42]|uniref:Probable amino acid efflux protein, LysE family n=1 Tax=Rhizobium etli (strain ATCC 51251 / DSM 11541 / JCM 21823 / NBRC 15573 / CFN 42) TaxID=347834 RepID=Q2K7B0_RHIEC|nr:LysE/ArgO family amino acid transporter [Rhizobium etli]ABC91276.1 probable amino acid efflux protein, LysE family [Rhizobium etli CFN 42]
MNFSIYVTGLMIGLSLIVAIGAQNAFILRQGLRNEHVFAVCLTCALSDAVLIMLGVTSLQQIAGLLPWLNPVMRYGGAAFLAWYGVKSLYSALRSSAVLTAAEAETTSFSRTLATCLALTWLNPHVYLDTVVLLGSISTRYPGQQASFAAGAVTGSFLFFFVLGYGATWLRPIFSRPAYWRMLETLVAATMWFIAFKLIGGM